MAAFSSLHIFRDLWQCVVDQDWAHYDYAANLKFRINLCPVYRFGTGKPVHSEMPDTSILPHFFWFNYNPGISIKHANPSPISAWLLISIKCHPYFTLSLYRSKYVTAISRRNQSVFCFSIHRILYKMQRHLKMTQCDHWFDPIFQTFIKHVIIEF